MADEAERAVREFGPPVATPSAIRCPAITANNFVIKPAMTTMLQNSSTFYNGLSQTSRTLVDAAAGGAVMAKMATEAFELLETMASNNYQWLSERMNPKPAGVLPSSKFRVHHKEPIRVR
ncbi:hypothetical protein L3X38_042423 [Prunus dulcis]|uniref:Uncharacterized protein n=1 Tax=Prunus dulcis TaxID=3755 RepID=A0AAD4UW99_PRUDU|nr:hypothetical protein L3X38_042423 [Prunus dulcis]